MEVDGANSFYRTPFALGQEEDIEELTELSSDESFGEYSDFEVEEIEETYSYFDYIWTALSYAITPITFTASTISDVALDGKAAWKQLKYAQVIREILDQLDDEIRNLAFSDPFGLSTIQTSIKEMIETLSRRPDEFEDDERSQHRKFLELYRNTLDTEHYRIESVKKQHEADYDQGVDQLHAIGKAIYNVRLHSFLRSVMTNVIEKGLSNEKKQDLRKLSLEEQRQAIINLPQADKAPLAILWYNCLIGHFGWGFDPHMNGNLPHQLFDLKIGDHITTFIRTGTPTIDTSENEKEPVKIVPEFLGLLRSCADAEEDLVYFNLQKTGSDPEGKRTAAIKKAMKNEGFGDSYYCFSHDTPYYYQTDKWEGNNNAKEFKESIPDMFLNDPNFRIPKTIKENKEFLDEFSKRLDELHTDIFFKHAALNQEERQIFLDIAYSVFIFSVILYTKPENVIICCKDAVDRAGKVIFILNFLLLLYTDKLTEESMYDLMVLIFGPPFIVKKKELIDERFDRLHRCHQKMLHPKVRKNLQKRSEQDPLLKMVEIIVQRVDGQELKPELDGTL